MNDCIECLSKVLEDLIDVTERLAKATKDINDRLTDLEKYADRLNISQVKTNTKTRGLERQVEEHRKRWLE